MAVIDGNIHRVRTLLQQGANPSHPLYWGEEWRKKEDEEWTSRPPPLHTASYIGHLKIVKMLVQAGSDTNEGGGHENMTPLHYACEGGQKEVAVYLIREVGCEVGELSTIYNIKNGNCGIIPLKWLQIVYW